MININNYEEYALDYFEGNLSDAEAAAMNAFLAENADVRQAFHHFSLLTLTADETVVFSHKNSLLKSENVAPKVVALPMYSNYYRMAAVAASLALMLGTSIYFYKNTGNTSSFENNIAINNKNKQAIPVENTQKEANTVEKTLRFDENKKNNNPTVTFAAAPAINIYTNDRNAEKSPQAAENTTLETTRETIALAELPVADRIEDFYFDTENQATFAAESVGELADLTFLNKTATSHIRAKNGKLIKALAPDGSLEKQEATFWEAFVPETRNTTRPTAFFESLRPAAYSK
jgi:hypothetical protein